jgi:hypothetical protein
MSNSTCPTRFIALVPLLDKLAIIIVLTPCDSLLPTYPKKEGKMSRTSLAYTISELFCIERNYGSQSRHQWQETMLPEQLHLFPNYPILSPKGNSFLMYFRL